MATVWATSLEELLTASVSQILYVPTAGVSIIIINKPYSEMAGVGTRPELMKAMINRWNHVWLLLNWHENLRSHQPFLNRFDTPELMCS